MYKRQAQGDVVWHTGGTGGYRTFAGFVKETGKGVVVLTNSNNCLLYTSDAADERSSVDLGGRRIIKKQTKKNKKKAKTMQ